LHETIKSQLKKRTAFGNVRLQAKTKENDEIRNHILAQCNIVDDVFQKLKEEISEILDKRRNELKEELPEILGSFEKSIAVFDHRVKQCNQLPLVKIIETEILSQTKIARVLTQVKNCSEMKTFLQKVNEKVNILVEAEKDQTQAKLDNSIKEFYNYICSFKELMKPAFPLSLKGALEEKRNILDLFDPAGNIKQGFQQIQLTQKIEIASMKQTIKKFSDDIQNIINKKPTALNNIEINRLNGSSSYDLNSPSFKTYKSLLTSFSCQSLESMESFANLENCSNLSNSISMSAPKSSNLEIALPDYFEAATSQKPFLYHFLEGINKLLYFQVPETIKENASWAFKEIELESFEVPNRHASIVTPKARLFICGGDKRNGNKNEYSQALLEIDLQKNLPIERSSMTIRRRNHGICYNAGYIYVIGGYNRGGYLKSCERYNIETDKWSVIEDFNSPGMCSMGVCSYDNKMIYKFGGELEGLKSSNCIERYNVAKNKWELLDVKPKRESEFRLGWNPGCLQINNHQLFVFGGCIERSLHNANFILDIQTTDDEQQLTEKIVHLDKVPLPVKDYYRPLNQPIIHKGVVFIQTTKKGRLLAYDGSKWITLNENITKNSIKH